MSQPLLESEQAAQILAALRFVPYRVEYRYDLQAMEMVGRSDKFDELEEGTSVPTYSIEIHNPDDATFELVVTSKGWGVTL